MPEFIERMIEELHQLGLRLYKARKILEDKAIEEPHSRELLEHQISAMEMYFTALSRRIDYEVTK